MANPHLDPSPGGVHRGFSKEGVRVNYFIRQTSSGKFFKNRDWLLTRAEAQPFKSFTEVMDICQEFQLEDVEMLLLTDGEEIILPIPKAFPLHD